MKNVGTITIILMLAITSACVSEQEKTARRACALDVSGDYGEVRPAGTAAGTLAVADESDKTDVKLTYTRGALYDGEQAFIDRIASADDKAAVTAGLTFGLGDDAITRDLVGGENISDDFGQSSKVGVSALALAATPSEPDATDAKVRYSVSLAIANGSDELKGALTATFEENRPDATSGDKKLHTEIKSFDVVFKRAGGVLDEEQSAECKAAVDGKADAP